MLDAELQELADLIPCPASVQAEILSDKDSMLQYFSGVLSFNLRTHPATVFLCTAALRIGSFQAMYYKNIFNRARPSRFSPDLMPLIDPPGPRILPERACDPGASHRAVPGGGNTRRHHPGSRAAAPAPAAPARHCPRAEPASHDGQPHRPQPRGGWGTFSKRFQDREEARGWQLQRRGKTRKRRSSKILK
jgi:hypothetical protein